MLETRRVNAQARAIPHQHLRSRAIAVHEEKEVARQRIAPEPARHQGRQTVEARS